ncbi:MAG TPA: hypothetical protein EYF96_04655 [Nitrospinaceae bacterium]|nr:hypothetical protein [Nitrospinaceae bacterium]
MPSTTSNQCFSTTHSLGLFAVLQRVFCCGEDGGSIIKARTVDLREALELLPRRRYHLVGAMGECPEEGNPIRRVNQVSKGLTWGCI